MNSNKNERSIRNYVRLVAPIACALFLPFFVLGGTGSALSGCPGTTPSASVPTGASSSVASVQIPSGLPIPVPTESNSAPVTSATTAPTSTGTDLTMSGSSSDCWKAFKETGNAITDINELARLCTIGLKPLVAPTTFNVKQGERKHIPLMIPAGCYRVIAVGGTGVTDIDLVLEQISPTGQVIKELAADRSKDDKFPMLHPNKELCLDQSYLAKLTLIVQAGSGEIAGGVWQR